MGNEKAVNQFIAHHSVVFEPQKRVVWVSTAPWQMGKYVAYDLNKIFSMHGLTANAEVCDSQMNIAADTFLQTRDFQNFVLFRQLKQQVLDGQTIDVQQLIASNPNYFHTWELAGDYTLRHNNPAKAEEYYNTALSKEISTQQERARIEKQITKCKSR